MARWWNIRSCIAVLLLSFWGLAANFYFDSAALLLGDPPLIFVFFVTGAAALATLIRELKSKVDKRPKKGVEPTE